MILCNECGNPIGDGLTNCGECGAGLATIDDVASRLTGDVDIPRITQSRTIPPEETRADYATEEFRERKRRERVQREAEARQKREEEEKEHVRQVEDAARTRAEQIVARSRSPVKHDESAERKHVIFTIVSFFLSLVFVAMVKPPLLQSFGWIGKWIVVAVAIPVLGIL